MNEPMTHDKICDISRNRNFRQIVNSRKPMVITQNGEAKAILQDLVQYEQTQESLAMLKMLAQSQNSLRKGDYRPVADVFSDLKRTLENQSE